MSERPIPEMSVVLATPDGVDVIRRTLAHLARQTVSSALEVVIVAPSQAGIVLDDEWRSAFAGVQVVELESFRSMGQANAAGVRSATAPIVALAEDHCFPEPEWAQHLVEAHRGTWDAVGPSVRNANPRSAVSWADLFIGYGPWLWPTEPREVEFLPGHNTSYKRDVLLRYQERLDALMEAETLLHWEMRRGGSRLRLCPSARVAHTNFSRWRSFLPAQYYNGRFFAGARASRMPLWKRVVFVGGSPAIPLLRLWRIWRGIGSAELRRRFLACLPALGIGLGTDGIGQLVGYAAGIGQAAEQVPRFEFHRMRHIRDDDRRDLSAG